MLDANFPPLEDKGVEVMEKELRSGMLSVAPEGATEEALISESMCGAVQALRERGTSKKVIARELGVDIKTVRKWCRRSWSAQKRPGRGRPQPQIGATFLVDPLASCPNRCHVLS
jgi:phage terminase Nu1 subunit (DNA packaging protein)